MKRLSTGGPWGTGLLILGIAFLITGFGYFVTPHDDLRPALKWIDDSPYFPISALAWFWVVIGIYDIWQAFTPPQRYMNLLASIGVLVMWSGIYYAHWAVFGFGSDVWSTDWQSGLIYNAFAGVLAAFGYCVNPPKGRPRRNA